MTTHYGDLFINYNCDIDLTCIDKVIGNVYIYSSDVDLPLLTNICGNLTIGAKVANLPVLSRIRGYLTIAAERSSLPLLSSIGCGLHSYVVDIDLPSLISIGGNLCIYGRKACLPALTNAGGYLYISEDAEFDYSKIKFGAGDVIAISEYALHFKDGMYTAGCRGPWTAEQALRHWNDKNPVPNRAKIFRQAITNLRT